jgi:MFS family permease
LASSLTCPRCGAANSPGTSYCVNCGSPLSATAPGAGPAPTAYPPAAPYPMGAPPMWDAERTKQRDRTKTGLLLLMLGILLSWLPVANLFGYLMILIGVILAILGRKAFGPAHSRNVVLAIGLFLIGIIVGIVGVVIAVVSGLNPAWFDNPPPEAEIAPVLRTAFRNAATIAIVSGFISGLASVLFTYALQKPIGHLLLWLGYAAAIAVGIVSLLVLLPALDVVAEELASEIVMEGSLDPNRIAAAFSGETGSVSLLNGIPSALFAGATYLAWSRVNRGEIPAPPAAPGMPPMIQPR